MIEKNYLCDNCKYLGYCRLYPTSQNNKSRDKINNEPVISKEFKTKNQNGNSFNFLMNSVPLRIAQYKYNDFTRQHLNKGFDAFHQEDYETALLHLLAPFGGLREIEGVLLAVALCYFKLGDYENASIVSYIFNSRFSYSGFNLDKLIDLSAAKQEDLRKMENLEKKTNKENETELNDLLNLNNRINKDSVSFANSI